jgi:hypothetical protein
MKRLHRLIAKVIPANIRLQPICLCFDVCFFTGTIIIWHYNGDAFAPLEANHRQSGSIATAFVWYDGVFCFFGFRTNCLISNFCCFRIGHRMENWLV